MKNIKYVPLFSIILSIMFGYYVARAEDNVTTSLSPVVCTMEARACPDGSFVSRTGPNCEFAKCPGVKDNTTEGRLKNRLGDIKDKIEANKIKREGAKDELGLKREDRRVKMQGLIDSIKIKRTEFKAKIEADKEQFKLKLDEAKAKFKGNLAKIKDENKKLSAEKIVDFINELNVKITNNFSDKIDRIENVLLSIESRISKAEDRGLDVTEVKAKVEKAKTAIDDAREAISVQTDKVYSTNITDETTLKAEMKTLRDTFKADIKAVRETVKGARDAVKDTAVTLAKIPKVDDEDGTTVEDNNNTNNQ
jgi:hypothetical protein